MTIVGNYKYEIDENNTVRVWENKNLNSDTPPFLLQPHYPNGEPWESKDSAEKWINDMISEWSIPPVETTETE